MVPGVEGSKDAQVMIFLDNNFVFRWLKHAFLKNSNERGGL